jgi:hypothetical protein
VLRIDHVQLAAGVVEHQPPHVVLLEDVVQAAVDQRLAHELPQVLRIGGDPLAQLVQLALGQVRVEIAADQLGGFAHQQPLGSREGDGSAASWRSMHSRRARRTRWSMTVTALALVPVSSAMRAGVKSRT